MKQEASSDAVTDVFENLSRKGGVLYSPVREYSHHLGRMTPHIRREYPCNSDNPSS
jgi:hypothetical protein